MTRELSKGPDRGAGRPADRPPWRRRALRLGRALGLTITEISGGLAVISRHRRAVRVATLKPGVSVVAAGKDAAALQHEALTKTAWLVSTAKAAGGNGVVGLGDGGWLVKDPAAKTQVEVNKIGKSSILISPAGASLRAELDQDTALLRQLGTRHVAWLLKRYQVDCVLDIGANTGQYGRHLRNGGFTGHIMSFEPVPEFAAAVEKLAADDEKWTVHQAALGSTEGTVPIHVQRTFSSLLASSDYGKQRFKPLREADETEQIDVPLRRLDAIFDELLAPVVASGIANPRVYLKMDTQGFDLEVFRGLGERVKDVVGLQSEVALLMIYEHMPRMPEAVATYEAAGFEISGLFPVTREQDGRVIEYDCMMVRPGALPG